MKLPILAGLAALALALAGCGGATKATTATTLDYHDALGIAPGPLTGEITGTGYIDSAGGGPSSASRGDSSSPSRLSPITPNEPAQTTHPTSTQTVTDPAEVTATAETTTSSTSTAPAKPKTEDYSGTYPPGYVDQQIAFMMKLKPVDPAYVSQWVHSYWQMLAHHVPYSVLNRDESARKYHVPMNYYAIIFAKLYAAAPDGPWPMLDNTAWSWTDSGVTPTW